MQASASVGSQAHYATEEAGVGETDVNDDFGEDLERGLDMWRGN